MSEPFWASGPGEILRHGVSLLRDDTDTNRRLAMISIDNSVELMMQTYIQLPKRISGVDLSRKERTQYCENFSSLLDGIENAAGVQTEGMNLGEIEWFHRLRNELYHQGNGLTVERLKVEAYAEIAKRLFVTLFGSEADLRIEETKNMDLLGRFLSDWVGLEDAMRKRNKDSYATPLLGFHHLKDQNAITEQEFHRLSELRKIRNVVVHGQASPESKISEEILIEIKRLTDKIK